MTLPTSGQEGGNATSMVVTERTCSPLSGTGGTGPPQVRGLLHRVSADTVTGVNLGALVNLSLITGNRDKGEVMKLVLRSSTTFIR